MDEIDSSTSFNLKKIGGKVALKNIPQIKIKNFNLTYYHGNFLKICEALNILQVLQYKKIALKII